MNHTSPDALARLAKPGEAVLNMEPDHTHDELSKKVKAARLRLLFGHVPAATLTAAGFAVIIASLVAYLQGGALGGHSRTWLSMTLFIAVIRSAHAVCYLRLHQHRDAPHWRTSFMLLTTLFSCCWGALPWMLPMGISGEFSAAMVGSVIGLSATGVSMLSSDRFGTRAWIAPALASVSIYCGWHGGPFGLFGMVSVSGFLLILWLEANRGHRRSGEMLRLRFAGEHLAQARAQALQEAENLSAAKDRFLATMSHEMRTPLHGMLGLSRLIEQDPLTPRAQQRMNLLQAAGRHLLTVINDVLDISRLREGLMELRPRDVNLPELVREACALANVSAQEKNLDVVLDTNLPLSYWVHADADRLRQILLNLLGNAVKFTERGQITLRMHQQAGQEGQEGKAGTISFEIADSGIGIAPEEVGRIFDAFHQVDGRFERRNAGSGLGLSVSQHLCKAMHSVISCESQPGVGTTFRFTLELPRVQDPVAAPATAAKAWRGPAQSSLPAPRFRGQVLLVEDNPVNVLVAQAELEQLGLTVVTAENGIKALEWLERHHVDLVLMDCHMPEMDGFEATRQIRAREVSQGALAVPVVALTASTLAEDRKQCLDAGMNDHLAKPYKVPELARIVQRYLPVCPSRVRASEH
jgi:signal transduction histidine kinase/ActR/RegA family two-component response regulator